MDNKSQTLRQAQKIIDNHVLWAMVAGTLPIPAIDTIATGLIQLDMLKQLCKLYKCSYSNNVGKAIVSAIIGAAMGKGISAIFDEQKVIERITYSMLSGAITYALGRVFLSNFEEGIGLIDIDIKKGEELFSQEFDAALDYVKSMDK